MIINIGIIDDDTLLLEKTASYLRLQPGMQCDITATSLGRFFELVHQSLPLDILLLDVELSEGINSLDHIDKLLALLHPQTKWIIITGHNTPDYILRAMLKGAAGYYVKGSGPEQLLGVIHSVMEGDLFISPQAAVHLRSLLQQSSEAQSNQSPLPESDPVARLQALDLHPREVEVALLLMEGHTYQQIAQKVYLSINTVRHYVKSLYRKLDADNKVQLGNILRPLMSQ
jgi:DNA-binding NarL/FixJ family response regulator